MPARILLLSLLMAATVARAADLSVLPDVLDGTPPRAMMDVYLKKLAATALQRRRAEYDKLKTAEDVQAYQERMRAFFRRQLGGFPDRMPLAAQVVGRFKRDGYRAEKIIFQSQPRHYVTATLYLPEAKEPRPAVLVPCGHSSNAKARDLYQRISILLAKNGMVSLCYDPVGQGERFQLLDADGRPQFGTTHEHFSLGGQSILVGRNTATYRIWDGMRAIDFLVSRPEVDPQRIGCTGISGGGTLTSYLMALDERITCAAPGCYLTGFESLLASIGPQDAEQNIYGQIAFGMDHADYLIMRAPQPTLICATTGDYFGIEGAWDVFRQSKRIYARLGLPERVDLVEVDSKHGFPKPMREASVRWMRRWLLGIDDAITEGELPVETDEDLQCTPRGQVMLIDGARSVVDINRDLGARLAALRKALWRNRAKALAEVRRLAGIRSMAELPQPEVKVYGKQQTPTYRMEKLDIQPTPGIHLPGLLFVPKEVRAAACLYLHGEGKHVDAQPGGPIHKLVEAGHPVLAVDLRGMGESRTAAKPTSHTPLVGVDWRDVELAYLLGASFVGMRCEDTLTCARWLADRFGDEVKPQPVRLVAIGKTGVPALHALALEPQLFQAATIRGSLVSWMNVLETPIPSDQLSSAVHAALTAYDLPDLATSLPEGKLTIEKPVDARGEPLAGGR